MLKTRVFTAVVLLALFLSALLFLPPAGWVAVVTFVAAIAAWEWGGLLAWGRAGRVFFGGVFAGLCLVISLWQPAALGMGEAFSTQALAFGRWFYLPAIAFWGGVVPVWMVRRWSLPKSLTGMCVGLLVLLPSWLALIQLRQIGNLTLLAIMATVWIADIAAYFFGRTFGRHKLAPTISPGKSWEGAFGGILAVVVYGYTLSPWLPPALSGNLFLLAVFLIALTAVSIVGDLFESLLKRQAGLKDSSQILPGHGGVLDRIDSLTSTLPIVAMTWLVSQS